MPLLNIATGEVAGEKVNVDTAKPWEKIWHRR
jgi:hypothetical protein